MRKKNKKHNSSFKNEKYLVFLYFIFLFRLCFACRLLLSKHYSYVNKTKKK